MVMLLLPPLAWAEGHVTPGTISDEQLKRMRIQAQLGDAEMQEDLGLHYLIREDYTQAAYWLHLAAKQGQPRAAEGLGFMYLGRGIPPNPMEAARWFRVAGEAGSPTAQFMLGNMYQFGSDGVPQDYVEAMHWHRLAAEQGNAPSQRALGTLYYEGEGVAQDYNKALRWFLQAAKQGDGGAQFHLGSMYFDGRGVPENKVTGYMWFTLSAINGSAGGHLMKDTLETIEAITPGEIRQAQARARECYNSGYQECGK